MSKRKYFVHSINQSIYQLCDDAFELELELELEYIQEDDDDEICPFMNPL